jgi:hypothetical protein
MFHCAKLPRDHIPSPPNDENENKKPSERGSLTVFANFMITRNYITIPPSMRSHRDSKSPSRGRIMLLRNAIAIVPFINVQLSALFITVNIIYGFS